MKKNILLFLLLNFAVMSAQNFRFVYDYEFAMDSLKTDSIKNELMILDVDMTNKKSIFANVARMQIDSAIIDPHRFVKMKKPKSVNVFTGIKVTKDYAKSALYTSVPIGRNFYVIQSDNNIVWEIQNDISTIEKYKVQKAATYFGGRNWTAWFTYDIPIQDGPYKFNGLPGLIVKLEDDTETHRYRLIGAEKLVLNEDSSVTERDNGLHTFFSNMNVFKEISVTDKKMKELWKIFAENPSREMSEMLNGLGLGNIAGDIIKPSQQRDINENALRRLKSENNHIEKDLLY